MANEEIFNLFPAQDETAESMQTQPSTEPVQPVTEPAQAQPTAEPMQSTTEPTQTNVIDLFPAQPKADEPFVREQDKPVDVESDKQYYLGAKASVAGAMRAAIDALEFLEADKIPAVGPTNLAEAGAYWADVISETNKEIEIFAQKTGNVDAWFTKANVGRVIPTLVTAPIAYSSVIGAGFLEGSIAYAESRGAGESKSSSTVTGLITATGVAGLTAAFKLLPDEGAKVLREIRSEFDVAGKEEASIYRRYANFTGKSVEDLTNSDKAVAILAQGGKRGAAYIEAAAAHDAEVVKAFDTLTKSKSDAISDIIGKGRIARIIKPLKHQDAFIAARDSGLFTRFKNIMRTDGPQSVEIDRQSILDKLNDIAPNNLSTEVRRQIRRLEDQKPLTMDDLFEMRSDLSKVRWRGKRTGSKKMETIDAGKYIDGIIERYIPENYQQLWGDLRSEMQLRYSLSGKQGNQEFDNAFGSIVQQIAEGKRTPHDLLEMVASKAGGSAKMNELMRAVGTENQIKFEKGLVKELYENKDLAGKNLGITAERIKNLGLVTREGRHMKQMLIQLDKAFNTDDFTDLVFQMIKSRDISGSSGGTNALTMNLVKKIEYSTMGNFWDKYGKKYIFFNSDSSKWLRHMDRVVKAIKDAKPEVTNVPALTDDMYRSFRATIRESIETTLREEVDGLEKVMAAHAAERRTPAESQFIEYNPDVGNITR